MRPSKILFLLSFILLALLVVACGSDYKTDFPPPPPNAAFDDVFPPMIDGMKSNISRMTVEHPLDGYQANYGDNKIHIEGILSPDKERADKYYKDVIVPQIDSLKNHTRGNYNGKWRGEGTDKNGRKWISWTNDRWVFVLSATDAETMEKTIDAFKYISR